MKCRQECRCKLVVNERLFLWWARAREKGDAACVPFFNFDVKEWIAEQG